MILPPLKASALLTCALGAALLLGAPGVAQAQQAPNSGVTSELERTANTTPEEKSAYADAAVIEIGDAASSIARLLDVARRGADAEVVSCLTHRLTAVRALQAVSENARVAMNDALSSNALDKADHEFRKIAVALSKSRMLLAEAQRCDSDQAIASGDTLIDTIIDDVIGPDGEDPGWIDETDIGFDPPQASPFL